MPLTPNQLWLTDAKYLEDKRAVLVCFSQLDLRRTCRMPFFPSFFVGKGKQEKKALPALISSLDCQRFRLEENKTGFKVTASTFTDLNNLANSLFEATGFRAVVLQPERQFLLAAGWSYFDCFHFFSEKEFAPVESSLLPKVKLPFFSEPLPKTVEQLLSLDAMAAVRTLRSIAASNALCLPLDALPPHNSMRAEALFENTFWQSGESRQLPLNAESHAGQGPLPTLSGATLVDFSQLWPTILTKPFYNIGSDTIDCVCCKPSNLQSRNLLPSTLVSVRFLQDGFYFDSLFPRFAQRFHAENNQKEGRLRRMREFSLPIVPVGPFNRHDQAVIPLHDALRLSALGKAEILSVQLMHWFCLKHESALSKKIVQLQKKISMLEKEMQLYERGAFKKHGLGALQLLDANVEFLFKKAKLFVLSKLLTELPPHLGNRESAFFRHDVGSAANSVAELILSNFKSFAQQQGGRTVLLGNGRAVVKSDRPLSLIQRFSEAQKIPVLIKPKNGPKSGL